MEGQASDTSLMGLRVLVVEDRMLVAQRIESMLRQLGCEPVGAAPSVPKGLEIVAKGDAPRAAVLDIDLAGEPVYPLAEALLQRGVSIVFATGYSDRAVPDAWRHVPRVQKPFEPRSLARALTTALAQPPRSREEVEASEAKPIPFLLATSWDLLKDSRNLMVEIDATISGEG